jgi:esterase/lipase
MDIHNHDYQISDTAYQWSVRTFSIVKRLLSVNIKLHHDEQQLGAGDIFLFNHFARFETFIPQYLIYQENGTYCRSVAASEFFAQDDAMASYLRSVGAVPNTHPRLLPFLATEILRGRKVVMFPEGGMVKDRRVQDQAGHYSIYSRSARERRKQHRGAAVLALALEAFKSLLHHAERTGNLAWIEELAERLEFDNAGTLLEVSRKPAMIGPANITFYPIRVSDNLLLRGMELFNRGLSRRASEELLIESNILLRDTDMDIRLGTPIAVGEHWNWWERKLLQRGARRLPALDDVFALPEHIGGWDTKILARRLRRRSERIRDLYMQEMYANVTVNLSHLASKVIFQLLEGQVQRVAKQQFHRMLYLCVKYVQREPTVHLHRSLRNPAAYGRLLDGDTEGLDQFLRNAQNSELVSVEDDSYHFSDKLCEEHGFDEVRLENVVEVYANEVAPLPSVTECARAAIRDAATHDARSIADLRYDDQRRAYAWDKAEFSKPQHAEINAAQTAVLDGDWFFYKPTSAAKDLCVVLVHGFLASPSELSEFGKHLADAGYTVIGVRLKGHGTSPWDLRERSWEDWFASLRRGFDIAAAYNDRVCIVGFSTGGALALRLAAERPAQLAGVCAVSVPIKFQNRNMVFVPLVHGANRLVRWMSSLEGVLPFRENQSEHPHINYRHMPIRGLYELRRLAADLEKQLPLVECPVTILQGDDDPVVVPVSGQIVYDSIASEHKRLILVSSSQHGILSDNIDNTQARVADFIQQLEQRTIGD